MKTYNQTRLQGGFSLVELLLVLAIIAALAVAAFIVYPKVQAGRDADQEAKIVTAGLAGIKALYSNRDYRNVSTTSAAQAGVFPDYMQMDDGTIQNKWGGRVTVDPANRDGSIASSTTTRRYFRIAYYNVPRAVCTKFVGKVAPYFPTVRISSLNGYSGANDGNGDVVKNLLSPNGYGEFNEEFAARKCRNDATNPDGDAVGSVAIFLISD